ncbi:MAG TPA: helix-turn-helix domain-containing protein [Fluviicola sp.]|nr:helix-turn-helix domain-containing protein [Fluviicola sp.]
MKHVSILVPESSVMQAIADPQYLFSAVNRFLESAGKTPLFRVQLVGASREVQLSGGSFTVHVDALLDEISETDLVIVPALFGDLPQAIQQNRTLIPWIIQRHENGAEVASLCVGAFLLASTGLLNEKKCSTHWGFSDQFQQLFPLVELVEGSIVTEENGIYSSGGANSYWNLLLHLVEKYTDRATAILAAKYFAIDIDRSSQGAFALFNGQKNHGDEAIKQVQLHIEANVCERFTLDALAGMAAVGKRSLERRFKKATGNSVVEYIQRVKIEAAKRSFESSKKNVSEVMFEVGYVDTKAFRDVFRKVTGITPIEYRNKYNKQVLAEV